MKRMSTKSRDEIVSKRRSINKSGHNTSILTFFKSSTRTDLVTTTKVSIVEAISEIASPRWLSILSSQFQESYFKKLSEFLDDERKSKIIYPPEDKMFTWLQACDFDKIKVVIIGQDPYHNPGQAHGLCFSVMPPCPPPPSLLNIFRELNKDLDIDPPRHGCLIGWARQGVLLLNACLSVIKNQPNSHRGKGWEKLTDHVICSVASQLDNVVFMLWGKDAQRKKDLIKSYDKHIILCSTHPSPLSAHRGFLGCKHFSAANEALRKVGLEEINWGNLPEK